MKYSVKLSHAVHILVFIYLSEGLPLSSDKIAESIHTNPGCVRQIMSVLRNAELIKSTTGHPKPELAREPETISLLDIYKAVEGDKPLLHLDTHTNPECGIGVNIQLALQSFYDKVQKDAENSMAGISLSDIIRGYYQRIENQNRRGADYGNQKGSYINRKFLCSWM